MGMLSYINGKKGEETARVYLEQKGFRIIEQNYHSSQGEVDLIAQDKDFLVFIEVKSYSFKSFGKPLYAVTKTKKQAIIHAARTFLMTRNIKDVNCRFDVISIFHKRDGSDHIDHIEDAFYVK